MACNTHASRPLGVSMLTRVSCWVVLLPLQGLDIDKDGLLSFDEIVNGIQALMWTESACMSTPYVSSGKRMSNPGSIPGNMLGSRGATLGPSMEPVADTGHAHPGGGPYSSGKPGSSSGTSAHAPRLEFDPKLAGTSLELLDGVATPRGAGEEDLKPMGTDLLPTWGSFQLPEIPALVGRAPFFCFRPNPSA